MSNDTSISDEPNWAIVLDLFYSRESPSMPPVRPETDLVEEEHPMLEQTNLDPEEIHDAVEFLNKSGLFNSRKGNYTLTEEGFQVAHDRAMQRKRLNHDQETSERQSEINSLLAGLTAVLAFASIIQAMGTIFGMSDKIAQGIGAFVIVLLITLIALILHEPKHWYKGLFSG